MTDNGSGPLPFESPEQENIRLREENARLRRLLAVHSIPIPQLASEHPPPPKAVETPSPVDKVERARTRIALFRSLFRGRDDVYARRWENADGRSGYVPAALKDWKAIKKSRPEERKKVDQKTRKFLPVTDAVIENHLLGKETVGVYPLLPDETCWFLAADFDKKTWAYDSQAFLETCRELSVPAALERSRSGKGGHIWIFFDRALPAITARKLGCVLLTRTMERRHQVGLDSYDRFFPNQDTMPKGGLGNLIALPLQFAPRKAGNSVFIDSDFHPYPDQWQFLSTIRRMPADAVEVIVAEAQRRGDLIGVRLSIADDEDAQDPWTLPPSRKRRGRLIEGSLPRSVQIVRANLVYVESKDLPPAMLNRLLRLAAFQNPEFYKAQAMRLSTYDKPRVIACGQEFPQHIAVPRGCLTETLALLEAHKIRPEVRDERFAGTAIEAEFQGQLRPFQEEAVAKITCHDEGILCAPTAFGKTAVAAWLIAKRKVNTLVVVHRQQLLDQWLERLRMFLDLPLKSIGHIGGGKTDRTGCVDVAVIQSLYRKDDVKDFVAEYGQVIVDECHHISAFTFEQVMRQVKARYVVGLTATPTRKDGHHPIIYMQCGPVRFNMSARTMTEATPFEHKVAPRHTEFRMAPELTEVTIQDIYAALISDASRNEMVASDIVRAIASGRCPLLLTGRTEHLKYFAAKLAGIAQHVFVLKGGMGKKQRRATAEALASVPENESRVILATGSYIGEGFDDARLDTLFLAMPISWKGTLQQYVGRLHRLHDNKRFVQVYDYVDNYVPMLARMYQRRLKGYSAIGYVIEQETVPPRPPAAALA
ncbi:MAG: DEAD/DEAH box helicase family protein [Acidobacteria bacterium]|nr:DEAD/DEAH box helicase family protein [Acidobacteriota bacterium]